MPATAPSTSRLPYLDWFRGLAVLFMIVCHAFNSFTRTDLRSSGVYLVSQYVGGLAAPLFLFIAGIMVGLRIENRDEIGLSPASRMFDVLKRAGFILLIGELMLFQQWVFQWSLAAWRYLFTADILNSMALSVAVSSVIALAPRLKRPATAMALGAAIAAAAPIISNFDWTGVSPLIRNYLVPGGTGRFPFFPNGAYVPFGLLVGFVIRRTGTEHLETVMCWFAFSGFGLIYGGEFFTNQPYSLYSKSDFWLNSPGMVVMRTGAMALLLVASFLWIRFGAGLAFVTQIGTTSLLVYWVHVELVYGSWLNIWKRNLSLGQATLATIGIIGVMYVLSIAKTRWFPELFRRSTTAFVRPVKTQPSNTTLDAGLS